MLINVIILQNKLQLILHAEFVKIFHLNLIKNFLKKFDVNFSSKEVTALIIIY